MPEAIEEALRADVAREGAGAVEPSDEALVRRVCAGDSPAFAELYRRYSVRMHRRLYLLCGPGDHLDDLLQQCFLEAYRNIGSFRGEARFSTWLTRIAINVGAQHLRRGRRKPPAEHGTDTLDEHAAMPPSQDVSAEAARALALLAGLAAELRAAVLMRDIEGMTLEEIATVTETTTSTVASRLARARELVARALRRRGGRS